MTRFTAAGSVTSTAYARAAAPCSPISAAVFSAASAATSSAATAAPSSAKRCAVARPSPEPAPVTTATWSVKRVMCPSPGPIDGPRRI